MPIYEYRCSDCRQTFEVRRCFSEADEPANCLRCDSRNTQRVLSRFYSKSPGATSSQSTGHSGCGGCSGGSCGSCHH